MAIFKCKMCGGALEITDGLTVAECEYCGTKQTLPKLDDDKKANLYDRASYFRRNNEFDKAAGVYEQILSEDNTDAESYWSLVLCRYGIEYVEDPKTRKRVPTVNRTQYNSIFADEDYISALKYADSYQIDIYKQEAQAIDEIQKGILAISQSEEPFDVFICYKETDSTGRRTPDSVYAQNIYKELTAEGYKVFFARITLEDKLGTAYEPYIFAALNSAKVMLVVGTKPEHFNAVWVRNEWHRYLSLIKSGKRKTLIPIYSDMNPYELPEEFSYIQAQDMGKIGFMQDLIHGINKLIPIKTVSSAAPVSTEGQMVKSLLDKAFNFMNSGDFKSAAQCIDMVYVYEPNNALYYVAKLMIEHNCFKMEDLSGLSTVIVDSEFYKTAIDNADDALKEKLEAYGTHTIYNEAATISEQKNTIVEFERALKLLDTIDTNQLLISDAELAKQVGELKEKLSKQIKTTKAKAKKLKKLVAVISAAAIVVVTFLVLLKPVIIPEIKYNKAVKLMNAEQFAEAIVAFVELGDYRDSREKITETKYLRAVYLMESQNFDQAISYFNKLGGYKDSKEKITETRYLQAVTLMEAEKFDKAIDVFEALGDYKDSNEKIEQCKLTMNEQQYNKAVALMESGDFYDAIGVFKQIEDYKDSAGKIDECNVGILDEKYTAAIALMDAKKFEEAIEAFEALDGYKDSAEKIEQCKIMKTDKQYKYKEAVALINSGNIIKAYEALIEIKGYKDSEEKINSIFEKYIKEKAKVGGCVLFGEYEQDNNIANGKEKIEWQVLEVKEDKVFVISKYALDGTRYNESYNDNLTWETCSLRKWLNNDFINSAFTDYEKSMIPEVTVPAATNISYVTTSEKPTQDRVFLISVAELENYFYGKSETLCKVTDYAISKGVTIYNSGNCRWWLRSPKGTPKTISYYGEIDDGRFNIDGYGVRPAMWIDLSQIN